MKHSDMTRRDLLERIADLQAELLEAYEKIAEMGVYVKQKDFEDTLELVRNINLRLGEVEGVVTP